MSEDTLQMLYGRVNGFFANMINVMEGEDVLVAVTILACQKAYIAPEDWEENTLIILKYPGEYSSVVSFMTMGEGVIGSYASLVKTGDRDILEVFKEYFQLSSFDWVELQ